MKMEARYRGTRRENTQVAAGNWPQVRRHSTGPAADVPLRSECRCPRQSRGTPPESDHPSRRLEKPHATCGVSPTRHTAARLVVNAHSDFLVPAIEQYKARGESPLLMDKRQVLEAGKVDVMLCAVGGDGAGFPVGYRQNLAQVWFATRLSRESEGAFQVVRSVNEIHEAKRSGSVALLLGLEGAHALEGDLGNLARFREAGIRWLGLTWNRSNELGDGCGETLHGGLTDFGREVIRAANDLGVLIDLSHASRKTCDDAIQVSRAPVIVSHSNSAVLCRHSRNVADEQISRIAAAGGVVGVNFFPRLLTDEHATGRDILAHILCIARIAGFDHVALGPDFVKPTDLSHLKDLDGAGGVDYGPDFSYPPGFADESCFPAVRELLRGAAIRDDDIAQVMGASVIRLLADVEECA